MTSTRHHLMCRSADVHSHIADGLLGVIEVVPEHTCNGSELWSEGVPL